MRIIHFYNGRCNPDSANGVEKMISHIASYQAALGHEVYIFGVSAKPEIPIPGVVVRHYRPAKWPWQLPERLFSEIQSTHPDCVHFHSVYIPLNILLSTKLREANVPYIVTPHGGCAPELLKRRPWLKRPFRYFFELSHLNRAAFVHAVGDMEPIMNYGVRSPVITIPNGIEQEAIGTLDLNNLITEARPLWKDRTLFLFLGRLDPEHKGLDLLLAGLSEAVRKTEKLGLVFVGPDWNGKRKDLEAMVQRLGLRDHVLFTGPVYGEDKTAWIQSAHFFVHTSRWEGMPLSVIEALARGKPCLVSAAANPCGLIGKYDCGIEVKKEPESISEGIIELAALSLSRREAMSTAALELANKELLWENIARKMIAAYQKYIH